MLRSLTFTSIAALSLLGVARADVYRWVDEHGETHYSDRWVPGSQLIKSNRLRPPVEADAQQAASDAKSPAQNRALAANAASQPGADKANLRAAQQDVAKVREQQCKQAKERYEKAINARHIYKPTQGGQEREYLSEADADAFRAQARSDVQAFCGSVTEPAQ